MCHRSTGDLENKTLFVYSTNTIIIFFPFQCRANQHYIVHNNTSMFCASPLHNNIGQQFLSRHIQSKTARQCEKLRVGKHIFGTLAPIRGVSETMWCHSPDLILTRPEFVVGNCPPGPPRPIRLYMRDDSKTCR